MGEAKQEETKAEAKPAEEKKEEMKEEEKAEEKKEEEAEPSPPPCIILSMDLHCVGCAKKIERCILKCKGVEEVETDIEQNKVTVKGIADPEALCSRIQKKTMRSVKVLSPLPPPDDAADSTKSQVVASEVTGMTTVELQVRMHCEACAQQLRRKILKMRGVQAAEAELSTGKVSVTGTMTAENLVLYIYKRTGKLASVIPPPPPPSPSPPPPPPKEEEKKEEGEKKEEEKPPEEKKEEEKAAEQPDDKKEEEAKEGEKGGGEEAKKEDGEPRMEGPANVINFVSPEEMMMKRMMYWNGGYMGEEENFGRRIMPFMPVYVLEQMPPPPPPPQMFSDENPNACCIS